MAIQQITILIVAVTILTLAFHFATALACIALQIKVERFVVFYGKPIVTWQTRLFPIAVGFIPCGGYVKLEIEDFNKRPLLSRLLVIASGPLIVLLIARVFLGTDGVLRHFVYGFPEIIRGAFSPYEHGVPLIRAFFRTFTESAFLGYGILAAKFAAFNMLPLPALAGGRLLTEVLGEKRHRKLAGVFSAATALVALPLGVCWTLALVSYFRHV